MSDAAAPDELTLAKQLSDGWHVEFARDPDDPRFVTLTCRHPIPEGEEIPPSSDGVEAQIHTVAFAVSICASQGIVRGEQALAILRDLRRQLVAIKTTGAPSLIIRPGEG